MKPTVGRIVHYVSYGTPNGEYQSEHRAAVVTAAGHYPDETYAVDLCVLNPEGLFFNKHVLLDVLGEIGGTWHWPEREE
jgi:hypothetical protein